jgi:hypothetical protein
MGNTGRVLPGMDDVVDDLIHPYVVLHLGKNKRTFASHLLCIVLHDLEVGTHRRRQIGLVDDEQVARKYLSMRQ